MWLSTTHGTLWAPLIRPSGVSVPSSFIWEALDIHRSRILVSFFFLKCKQNLLFEIGSWRLASFEFCFCYLLHVTSPAKGSFCRASLVVQLVKNLPAVREIWVWSLGWEDPLEKGKATPSSILAWRIPWAISSKGLHTPWGCKESEREYEVPIGPAFKSCYCPQWAQSTAFLPALLCILGKPEPSQRRKGKI